MQATTSPTIMARPNPTKIACKWKTNAAKKSNVEQLHAAMKTVRKTFEPERKPETEKEATRKL